MNYTFLIGQDEYGTYIAKIPALPGCDCQWKNIEQTMKRVREAIKVRLEAVNFLNLNNNIK